MAVQKKHCYLLASFFFFFNFTLVIHLPLVRRDETIRAPERDYGITTLEVDASALAPQTVPDITPQVFYSTEAPEAYNKNSSKENTASLHVTKPTLKWLWIVAVVIATAIAIGVGVGIWRLRDQLSHRPLVPQTSQDTSISNITRAEQYILNDTSLAALVLTNGDRHLFFQDNTGLIRSAIRTTADNQWSMGPNISVSSNVKKYTPLAVDTISENTSSLIVLYYVSERHILHSSSFSGSWIAQNPQQKYTTAVSTRSLCIAPATYTTEDSTFPAYLFYEKSTGGVSALLRSVSSSEFDIQYVDVTHQVDPQSSVPFACPTTWTGQELGPTFYVAPISSISMSDPNGPANFSFGFLSTPGNYSSMHQSDVALFGSDNAMWINGTQPASFPGPPSAVLPDNSFPFTRLASATLADRSATFLYHQLNGTTFAEEQWDASLGAWTPTVYITVSDS